MQTIASYRILITYPLLCSLVCAACGGFPEAPAYPHQAEGFVAATPVQRPGLPLDPPPPLLLQPGDAVSLELRSEETQTLADLMIDGTGRIHLPLAGDVEIGGVGLVEAESRVTSALKKHDRYVQVTLTVTGRGGQRATVLGAVNTQGPVQLVPGARVTDVLAGAGGAITASTGPNPVPVADLSAATLMRNGKPVPVDMNKALRGDPAHNVYIHPGDHMYIPPSIGRNISVLGQVGTPIVFPHREGLRLTEGLALAGGISVGGDKSDIRVIRGTLEKPLVYETSFRDLVDGDQHDVLLSPGDIIFVTDDPIEDFGEVMAVISPALSLGLSTAALAISLERTP